MDAKDIRYIVFLLNTEVQPYHKGIGKVETHEGIMFACKSEAREYAIDCVRDKLCTRFVIGVTFIDPNAKVTYINNVETFGFKHDKKNVIQLELFK